VPRFVPSCVTPPGIPPKTRRQPEPGSWSARSSRAREVLAELEERHLALPERPQGKGPRKPKLVEASLFAHTEDPVLVEVREANLLSLTPEEAMILLKRWQRELRSGY